MTCHTVADTSTLSSLSKAQFRFTTSIIQAATSRLTKDQWPCAARCVARISRSPCRACVYVQQKSHDDIHWTCPSCGRTGTITGYAKGIFDYCEYAHGDKGEHQWGFDWDVRQYCLKITDWSPPLYSVIWRGCYYEENDFFGLNATLEELDALYTIAEHERYRVRSPRQEALVNTVLQSLCTGMDGF